FSSRHEASRADVSPIFMVHMAPDGSGTPCPVQFVVAAPSTSTFCPPRGSRATTGTEERAARGHSDGIADAPPAGNAGRDPDGVCYVERALCGRIPAQD